MHKTTVRLPAHITSVQSAILAQSLEDISLSRTVIRENNRIDAPWIVEWLFEDLPNEKLIRARLEIAADIHNIEDLDLSDFDHEDIEDRDWLRFSYQQFEPFVVGPFFIYGSHYEGPIHEHRLGLQIDAATAFGSGEHPTTKGCLFALEDCHEKGFQPQRILDMGTGSGVLAIAATKLWNTPVLAVDNDPESIAVTKRHMAANQINDDDIETLVNEGFAGSIVQNKGPFDLVLANILAGPLKDMATELTQSVAQNGFVILSGILNEQAQDVIKTYRAEGLSLKDHKEIGEWSTLVLSK